MSTGTAVKRKGNPNREKKHKVAKTPQQIAFKAAFTDPKSPTYNNARQSALAVGYSKSYAETITAQGVVWINNDIFRSEMLAKAEQNLDAILNMARNKAETIDKDRLKIAQDTAKFVSERLGKRHYSARIEATAADGGHLFKNDHIQAIDTTFRVID